MTEAGDLLPFGYVVRHDKHDPDGSFYRTNVLTNADKAAGYTITPVYTRAPITPSDRSQRAVVEANIDALIDMIIAAYHTTRLADVPAALHIRSRLGERLTNAIAALQPPAADNATRTEDGLADEWRHVFEDRRYSDELVGKMVRANADRILTALRPTGQPAIAAADNGALVSLIGAARSTVTTYPIAAGTIRGFGDEEADLGYGPIKALREALAALEAPTKPVGEADV